MNIIAIFISFFVGLLFGVMLMGLCAVQKQDNFGGNINENNNNIC